ncbi:MAG: hypothetical protein R2864_07565 [Syntrophotaleaceae bacterium]
MHHRRARHLGTCHVGIATQLETLEEASAQGLKRLSAVLENGIIYETTFFRALGEEIRLLTARSLPPDQTWSAKPNFEQQRGLTASTWASCWPRLNPANCPAR